MDYTNNHIRIFERVPENRAEHGFLNVTNDDTLFNGPTLLCLGPVDCFHGDPVTANGFAKAASRLIGRRGVYDGSLRVLSITHPYDHGVPSLVEEYNYNAMYGDIRLQPAWDAVRNFTLEKIVPILYKNGHLLHVHEIAKKLRNINIITHSLGGIISQQIGNILTLHLLDAGLNETEVALATKQVCVVTLGNPAHLRSGLSSFSQLHIYNLGDRIAYARCAENHTEICSRVNESGLAGKNLSIFPISEAVTNNVVFCVGDIQRTQTDRKRMDYRRIPHVVDPYMLRVHFPNGKMEPGQIIDLGEHKTSTYVYFGVGTHGLMMPVATGICLSNAVLNSMQNAKSETLIPLPDILQLLSSPNCDKYYQPDENTSRLIRTAVEAEIPDVPHESWQESVSTRRAARYQQELDQMTSREAFDYSRSDPKSEKGYSRLERVADGIRFNDRISEASGKSSFDR